MGRSKVTPEALFAGSSLVLPNGEVVMGADTWQIERDIGLARLRKDTKEVERLQQQLIKHRDQCTHDVLTQEGLRILPGDNPDLCCWKCGQTKPVVPSGGKDALVPGRDGVDREHPRCTVVAPQSNLVVVDLQAAIAAKDV